MARLALPAPPGFGRHRRRARRKLRSPDRVGVLALNAWAKWKLLRPQLATLRRDLPTLIRLARAWAAGDYRAISWKALVSVVAAVLYFLNPYDLIPDFIPFIGYVDDAAVVAYVVKQVHDEVERFQAWERTGWLSP